MLHSYSRAVMQVLLHASTRNRRFTVLVTEARPGCTGFKTARLLREHGIPVEVILDVAVGHYIRKASMVLVGAEGIVESGGLINQV